MAGPDRDLYVGGSTGLERGLKQLLQCYWIGDVVRVREEGEAEKEAKRKGRREGKAISKAVARTMEKEVAAKRERQQREAQEEAARAEKYQRRWGCATAQVFGQCCISTSK